jgi:uncharacterized protein (TIGR02284 family)
MTQNSVVPNKEVLDMLVEISRYGARFYDQTAERVQDRGLKSLFMRMAEAKHALVRNFSSSDDASKQPLAAPGSLLGEYQRQYSELRTRIGTGQAYLAGLAHLEQQLLKALEKQAFEPGMPLSLRTAAALCIPPLQAAVADLSERKDDAQRKVA